ncbi:unnamed protein product, partial [Closterium sp. NIES-54]
VATFLRTQPIAPRRVHAIPGGPAPLARGCGNGLGKHTTRQCRESHVIGSVPSPPHLHVHLPLLPLCPMCLCQGHPKAPHTIHICHQTLYDCIRPLLPSNIQELNRAPHPALHDPSALCILPEYSLSLVGRI